MITGGSGDDTLTGGLGADTLRGGEEGLGDGDGFGDHHDEDTFRYTAAAESDATNTDTIEDFDPTEDRIFLDGLVKGTLKYLSSAGAAFASSGNTEVRFDDTNKKLEISLNGNTTIDMVIALSAVAIADLDANTSFIWGTAPVATTQDATTGGGTGNDLFIAVTGDNTITTGGGDDRLEFGTQFFLDGAELIGNDLKFFFGDDTASYTVTIVDHLTSPLGQVTFDFEEHGTLETFDVASDLDSSANTGNTVLAGTSGDDPTLIGGSGNDIIFGNAGNDTLTGNAGDDILIGGPGDDTLNGGSHGSDGDTASYHDATAFVTVNLNITDGQIISTDQGTDTLIGIENIIGSDFNDILTGDAADNFLDGSDGDDTLTGNAGDDILIGGDGNDTLDGGLGADKLDGGFGSDVYIYNSTAESSVGETNRDTIEFFDAGGDQPGTSVDTIQLSSAFTAAGSFVFLGDETNSFSGGSDNPEARFNSNTRILEIDADGDGIVDMEIELTNVDDVSLNDDDFTIV